MVAAAIIVVVIVSTAICHSVARHKNLSVRFWICLGAVFGPLAIPFVLLMPARKVQSANPAD